MFLLLAIIFVYSQEVSKEGYYITAIPNKKGSFVAQKLGHITVKVTDEKDQPMSNVLLSLSGGQYRNNNLTQSDGAFAFSNLVSCILLYEIASEVFASEAFQDLSKFFIDLFFTNVPINFHVFQYSALSCHLMETSQLICVAFHIVTRIISF